MQEKQFDQKISNWSKIANKTVKEFQELQETLKDIEGFIKQHENSEEGDISKLSAMQLQRVKKLRRFVKKEIQKYANFKYYYDTETKVLCENIRNKKKQSDLYINRMKAIRIFQTLTNSPSTPGKPLKLHKLQRLISQAESRIQRNQSNLLKPLSLAGKAEQASTEFKREINFFLIIAWIISFLLANKDPSECLDVQIVGVMNFRHWLWGNGGITLYLTVMLVIFDVFDYGHKDQDSDDEDEQEEDRNNLKQIVVTTLNTNIAKSKKQKTFQIKDKNAAQQSSCCGSLSMMLLSIGILAKFVWIYFGIIIFLNDVNFDNCGDNVLNYCSLEFLAFFSFTMYGLITYVMSLIKNKIKKPLKPYPSDEQLNQLKTNEVSSNPEADMKLSIEGNMDDLQDVLKRVMVWTLIGWVYDFVLFSKDHSGCLDEHYDNFSPTFRNWLLIDGITSLVTFVLSILLIIVFIVKRQHFMIWQLKEQFFQISMSWICNNLLLTILFGLILFFKATWLIVGVIVFCLNINLGNCSGNVPNFLVAYFTESVYVIIFTFVSLAKGYRKSNAVPQEKKSLDESRANLLQETEQKSPQKGKGQTETIGSKKMIREKNNNQKTPISQVQILPRIKGSEKKLINENEQQKN